MKANKMCAILGNEHEYSGLMPLTENRPLSTLYFDCKYRIMDFAISSAANANIRTVYIILNEGRVKSVFDHLGGGREWGLDSIGSFYQDILRKKAEGKDYYCNIIDFLSKSKSAYTVFIGNKMLCNIDLRTVLNVHQSQDATMTAVFKRVPREKIANDDQILDLSSDNRVTGHTRFGNVEKKQDLYNLSMSIFMVKTDWLIEALKEGESIGMPASIEEFLIEQLGRVDTYAYEYSGYLSNIYNMKSYYDANMDMLDPENFNSLLFSSQKVITRTKNEVATYFSKGSKVSASQLATGCIIDGKIDHSLISRCTTVEKDAEVVGSIVMANANIKQGASVKYAILDKCVTVEPGVRIEGTPENPVVIKKHEHVCADVIGG
mgnify:FL=1